MFDCPFHGRTGFQHGCRHFEQAVDDRQAIPVAFRNYRGAVFLLCAHCAREVDVARGVSSDTLDSDDGMRPHLRHLACSDCTWETYSTFPDIALVEWMRVRYEV